MRLTLPYQTDRLGAVRVFGVQKVFELESGSSGTSDTAAPSWGTTVCKVPGSTLLEIQSRMAVVVPCRNEHPRLLEGVLGGIPHECLVVFVSKSDRDPIDRYRIECEAVERFCRFNQRPGIVVHQSDPAVGSAFAAAGLPELADGGDGVRSGKGEAMMVGIALARLAGKDYVGFVDADNYVPGSVTEYVDAFAADFALCETPYAMVRILWQSKPKVVEGALFFQRFGRASETTNRYLNLYLSHLAGFGTEAIRTGNAGEHAISMPLALELGFAEGFGVEPAELVQLFERYGGVPQGRSPEDVAVMRDGVDVYQVESLNPHFHEDKGEDHVTRMRHQALATVHASRLCPGWLREEIERELERDGSAEPAAVLGPVRVYPPLSLLDFPLLATRLGGAASLEQFRHPYPEVDLLAAGPLSRSPGRSPTPT